MIVCSFVKRMSTKACFEKQLAYGRAGEAYALRLINWDSYELAPDEAFPDYDIKTQWNGAQQTWEVKRDGYTKYTGNIVIEFESSGRPSGIMTTKADTYIYLVDGEPTVFFIPTDVLRRFIAEGKYHAIRGIAERGKNKAYFFRRSLFEDYEWTIEGV